MVHHGECPTFDSPDLDEYNVVVRLLALGLLIESDFFSYSTPPTALNFEVVAQRFEPRSEYLAIEARRRDGSTLSGGHRYEDLRFTRPLAAPSNPRLVINESLLTSLAACLDVEDSNSSRIAQSVMPFLLANRMDGSSSFQSDLFWLATAIEQLLDVSNRPRRATITETFSQRVSRGIATPGSPSKRIMLATWARELYGRRSDIHGRPHPYERWDTGWHAFLASHAFGLLVKQALASEHRYALSNADELMLRAFAHRVAAMRSRRLADAASVWDETARAVRWAQTRQQIAAQLRDADQRGDP